MKLVIVTQFMENYGAHDWDGKGECPSYWKAKGGDTLVFPNLDWMKTDENRQLAERIIDIVSYADDYSQEYVIDWSFEEDDTVVTEEWEGDHTFINEDGMWVETNVRKPYACSHAFKTVEESWVRDSEFKRVPDSYKVFYVTHNDEQLDETEALAYAAAA